MPGTDTATERQVGTADRQIYVRETPGDGPPIVLIHALPDDRIYDKLLPELAPRRAVAFDQGYGRSAHPDQSRFTPEDHPAELTAVLDELDIDRAVLVGHDASGPDLASELAELFPDPDLHLLLDAGHWPQHDRPVAVAGLIGQAS